MSTDNRDWDNRDWDNGDWDNRDWDNRGDTVSYIEDITWLCGDMENDFGLFLKKFRWKIFASM